jgi:hypothetical protein
MINGLWNLIQINKTPVNFQIDTRAKCNVTTRETLYDKLKNTVLLSVPEITIKSYSGHRMKADGIINLPVQHKGDTFCTKFYVVDVKSPNKTCTEMNLVQRVQSVDVDETNLQKTQDEILDKPEYQELFKGLGCLPVQYSIKLDSSVSPTIHRPRKIPIALHDKVRQELTRIEKNRSHSETEGTY